MTEKKAFLLLSGIVVAILIFLFREAIWHPTEFLFASTFDGIKNYYTFIYYILYDKGIHFSGMNSPFGEHIIYTDNQPLFTIPLRFIHRNILDLSQYLIGIFNYIIILSLLFGCWVLYKILRKCLLPQWYSIITAILIVFLAQQNNMFNFYFGAYALSYTWVIPLQWLLIIKIFERVKVYKWAGIYIIVVFFTGFIHPYYLLFSFLLITTHAIVYLAFYAPFSKTQILFIALVFISAGLPLIAFKAFMYLTDVVADRPVTPWGMAEFRGNLAEVFYPAETVFANYWKTLFNLEDSKYDGFGYIGVAGIICFILSLIKGTGYILKGKFKVIFKPVLPFPIRLAFWPAVGILLFALGFPFRLHLEKFYEYFPFVKQFRVLARFLWIFYYIYSVYVAFYFYQLYRYLSFKGATKFSLSLLFLILFSWALDAKINVWENTRQLRENKRAKYFTGEENNFKTILAAKGLKENEFQAILPFPYFTAGSEKIFFQPLTAMPAAMAASIQTGLPLINGMMSRTSLSQSLKGIQLISSDFIEKDLLNLLPNNKPLLLLVVRDTLQDYEKNIISKSSFISQTDSITLYQLPLSAFKATAKTEALTTFLNDQASLFQTGNIYKTKPVSNFFYTTFIQHQSAEYLFQKGALTSAKGPLTLYKNKIPNANPGQQEYDFSVWINLQSEFPLADLIYEQFDKDLKKLETKQVNLLKGTEIYQNWVNVNFKFNLLHPKNTIKVTLNGNGLVVDDLLIKPTGLGIYIVTPDSAVIYNNYLIRP